MPQDNTPTGWTDDMNIDLIGDLGFDEFVDEIIARFKRYEDFDHIYEDLIVPNVAVYDREIVLDRALGGIVRAMTGMFSNRPDKAKDPIAYRTFTEVWNSFDGINFFIFKWKKPGGFWKKWNDWRIKTYLK